MNVLGRNKILWVLVFATVPLAYTTPLLFTGRLRGWEDRLVDFRYRYANPGHPFSDRVVLVDIDEGSLARGAEDPKFGRWPWRRDIFPPLLEYLEASGAKLVLFDLIFTERSEHDDSLAEASAALPVSHSMQFLSDEEATPKPARAASAGLPSFVRRHSVRVREERGASWAHYDSASFAAGRIGRGAFSMHSVTYNPDRDGVSRRSRLLFRYGEDFFPSLGLRAFDALSRVTGIVARADSIAIQTATRSVLVPLEEGSVRLHYPSEREMDRAMRERRVPIESLIETVAAVSGGEVDPARLPAPPERFAERVVIIGTSAAALHDVKITPYGVLPGMMLHAVVISNLMDGHFPRRVPDWVAFLVVLVLLPGSTALVLYATQTLWRILLPLLVFVVLVAAGFFAFRFDVIVPLMPMLVSYPVSYLGSLALLTFTEGAEKRKFKSAMSKYLSPDVLNEVISRGELRAEVGNRRVLTVLFSDIRSFTTISEKLDGGRVVEILNEYLSQMVDVIFAEGGTLDKYIGDAIMAFWGAPVERPDHAIRAVRAAFGMQRALRELHKIWAARGTPLLNVGIGIHTGEMIVGNIGSNRRLDYTVIGDNVNLGSRTEGLTKVYHVPILITEATYAELGGLVPCRMMDLVAVKGKSVPIAIYEPLDTEPLFEGLSNEQYAREFTEAFRAYLDRDWERARRIYTRFGTNRRGPDAAVELMLERIKSFRKKPPAPEWDGSFTMTTK